LAFVALTPVVETVSIWMFKVLMDEVLLPRNLEPFGRIALAYIGLSLLGGAITFGDDCLTAWIGARFVLRLRTKLFRHLQELSLDFFEQRRLGDILARLSGDTSAIEDLL